MSLQDAATSDNSKPAALASEFLNEHQAAAFLNVGLRSLRRWRTEGRGPAFMKFSAMVRYRRGTLLKWAEAQSRDRTVA